MAAGQEPPVWPPRAEDLVDILVYVTVLSLAVEYVPTVLSETYTVSLITAVLLKIVLEVVVRAEGWVKKRWAAASTSRGKALAGLAMLGVVLGTKVLVLELIALALGDRVSLGGFVSVTCLVMGLMLARSGVRRLLA